MSSQDSQPEPESQSKEAQKRTDTLPVEKGIDLSYVADISYVYKIQERFGGKARIVYAKPKRLRFDVRPEDVVDFAKFVRDEIGFDHPISVTGTDYPEDNVIEVVYHIGCCTVPEYRSSVFAFAVKLPRDNPRTPTLMPVYRGVEYHERETFEMLGVIFEGHPKLERLLLPEDWADIPPLRKDFNIKGR